MESKRQILLTFNVIISINEEELDKDLGEHDRIAYNIEEAIKQSFGKNSDDSDVVSTKLTTLDLDQMNCGKCAKCGAWSTDMEQPEPMFEFSNGATVNEMLLCDLCLPKDHKWAF